MTTLKTVVAPTDLGSGHAIDLLTKKAIVPSADVWRKQLDNTQASADSDAIQHSGNVAVLQNFAVRSGGDFDASPVLDATDKSLIRLTGSGTVFEIIGGEDGKLLTLMNTSTADVGIVDVALSGAVSGNGIAIAGGGILNVRPNAAVYLQYDATSGVWRCPDVSIAAPAPLKDTFSAVNVRGPWNGLTGKLLLSFTSKPEARYLITYSASILAVTAGNKYLRLDSNDVQINTANLYFNRRYTQAMLSSSFIFAPNTAGRKDIRLKTNGNSSQNDYCTITIVEV